MRVPLFPRPRAPRSRGHVASQAATWPLSQASTWSLFLPGDGVLELSVGPFELSRSGAQGQSAPAFEAVSTRACASTSVCVYPIYFTEPPLFQADL